SEIQSSLGHAVAERLDSHPIAGEQEPARPCIPDRQPEHAAEAGNGPEAPFLVAMHNHFGIAPGRELMTAGDELTTKLSVVVDLAVEHRPDRLILVVDRLMSASQVDDAQPTHAQADAGLQPVTGVIWSTMPDGVAHLVQQIGGPRR